MAEDPKPRRSRAAALLRDLVGVAGIGCVTSGVWQIHEPSAWIVLGVVLLGLAIAPYLYSSGR